MFAGGEAAQHNAGEGEEGYQVARQDHGPGSPGVVGEKDSNTGHQVEVTNHNLVKKHISLEISVTFPVKSVYTVLFGKLNQSSCHTFKVNRMRSFIA